MITEDYVSFEVAKLLKEKGFDENTLMIYSQDGNFMLNGVIEDTYQVLYAAPTLQMAMKWLRYEKNIHIKVHCSGHRNYLVYAQSLVTAFPDFCIESATCSFNTYEEAVNSAIKHCLTNLIK